MKYVYPAVFTCEAESGYSVWFPDVPMGATQGECLTECMEAAEKFLGDALCFIEDESRDIPEPSEIHTISDTQPNDVITLVSVDTAEYRRKYGVNLSGLLHRRAQHGTSSRHVV